MNLSLQDVGPVVRRTLRDEQILDHLTLWDEASGRHIPYKRDIPFLARQTRRIMRNCGEVNPHRIEDSLQRGAYSALARALEGMATADVRKVVEASGLIGRGESDEPSAEKWTAFVDRGADPRCLVAYVKGWETAAASDCVLLEGDPHLVLEGMALAGLATGCSKGRIGIPPGREGAARTLAEAVEQATAYGLLGEHILGTSFSFTVEVTLSAGDRRPQWAGDPSELSHNIETLANLPRIVGLGAAEFRGDGTEDYPGTSLVSLGGDLCNRGVAEVPCGTPVLEIIESLGGGPSGGAALRGVALGGPRGRLVPLDRLKAEDRITVGPGTSDVVAFDARACVVERALQAAGMVAQESCGRCAPCRIGTKRMEEILDGLRRNRAGASALADLKEIGEVLRWTAGCRRGAHSADAVVSALDAFEEEFVAHLPGGQCPSEACPISRSG